MRATVEVEELSGTFWRKVLILWRLAVTGATGLAVWHIIVLPQREQVTIPDPPPPATAPAPMTFGDLAALERDTVFASALRQVERREGFRSHPYLDSIGGAQTIGYGWNLSVGVSEDLARLVAAWQLADAHRRFNADWPPFADLSPRIQWALAQVAFQLGVRGAEHFPNELAAIERRDVRGAVVEIRNSLWYQQTPVRAEDLIRVLREDL